MQLTAVIKHCKDVQQLQQVHAQFITTGLLRLHPPHILTNILHSINNFAVTTADVKSSSAAVLSYAISVFNSISNPSTFCYNTIIRAHTLLSAPLSALGIFARMHKLSVPPDFHSFPFALKACAQLRAVWTTVTIHSQVFKFGFVADLYVVNCLIHGYAAIGSLTDAYWVFDESPDKDVISYNTLIDGFVKFGDVVRAREVFNMMPVRDAVSWGTLVAGYAQAKQCKEAIELFCEMMNTGIRPDNRALVSALSACAERGELERGKAIHEYIKQNRIRVDSFLSTGLVDLYAKCGCIETAADIFESSPDKSSFTWNAMITGLAMHGHGHLSLNYFSRMKEAGIPPDGISFLGVLVGCSHTGLVREAQKLFDEMESVYGVTRELKHYGCMADLLGRAGLIKEAMEMIKGMPTGGDAFVWAGLLGGCRIHGNVGIAEKAAEQVMELKPKDGGVYSIMANVYASAERWDEVTKIRRLMDANKKVKRIAGYSLIQLNGVMHEFIAGDTLHPLTDEIYLVLNEIREHQFETC
ncbi:pentatricopeptide repeat-containing protein [Tripterygium wilfordii]|uniref:Pentatricopeptide repeat-containing protein n=1 Tax=Tripterygium wilfordii TaxID=458696 RepID=A0A7J7CBA9_TRIWF|nr:pentatricopeptide repeat-containing protein At5g61800 [Tripterygium wilfordii]KAF5731016.1 pentatricopeptide repeat-containing protein [Tripterygium wilfordii]